MTTTYAVFESKVGCVINASSLRSTSDELSRVMSPGDWELRRDVIGVYVACKSHRSPHKFYGEAVWDANYQAIKHISVITVPSRSRLSS